MADDMIGTLFESDATSLLDGEATHLLTELESMASDSGQSQSNPIQQQYYDFGGGGQLQQQLQSPQAIRSPAGSLHSPGGLMSPSNPQHPQHFSSPPNQQSPALQRQMSAPTQFPSYTMQQQVPQSPSNPSGSNPMWRQHQSQYPHPAQSPQHNVPPGYMGQPAGHMPQHGAPGQYMSSHPSQARHISHSQSMGQPPDMYGHMQPQHPQQMSPYNQQMTGPGYMHPGMGHQSMNPSQQHMMPGQPRMPRPGMPQYVMSQQRMAAPSSQPGVMRPPSQMNHPQMMSREDMHQQQQMSYRAQHHQHPYSQMPPHQSRGDMMPPGHYASGPPMSSAPFGYNQQQQQAMMSPRSSQASFIQQSSQQYHMATTSQSHQNGSSLEQLEKMVVPMGQQGPPISQASQHYMSQSPHMMPQDQGMMSPRGQQMHPNHQGPPNMMPMRPNGPHMMTQHRHMNMSASGPGIQSHGVHMPQQQQQAMYGGPPPAPAPPKSPMTPIQTINQEIDTIEHRVRQLRGVPQPHTPEHEKELMAVEERLRSLNSQKSMMLQDIQDAKKKEEAEKAEQTAAAKSTSTPHEQTSKHNSSSADEAESKTDLSLQEPDSTLDSLDSGAVAELNTDNDNSQMDNDELTSALSAIVDEKDIPTPPPLPPITSDDIYNTSACNTTTTQSLNDTATSCTVATATTASLSIAFTSSQSSVVDSVTSPSLAHTSPVARAPVSTVAATSVNSAAATSTEPNLPSSKDKLTTSTPNPLPAKKEPKAKKSKSKKNSQSSSNSQPSPNVLHYPPHQQQQMPPHMAGAASCAPSMHNVSMMSSSSSNSGPGIVPHPPVQSQPIMIVQQPGVPNMMQPMPPGHGPLISGPQISGHMHGAPILTGQPSISIPSQHQQQSHVMPGQHMPPAQSVAGPIRQPIGGPILVTQPAPNSGMPYPAMHPRMPVQQGLPRSAMPPQGAPQLRAIAPRPHPQMAPGGPMPVSIAPVGQPPQPVNGPSSGVNCHLPELLEDPADSVSDIPSTVDSPALSDVSTPGRARKPGSKGKTPGKKGRKPGSTKKPPASLLKLKKRKRKNSDSMSEGELSPGPAHTPDSFTDSLIVHRRSGRVTKKQKYVDELELDLSDDEEKKKAAEDDSSSGIILQQQTETTQEEAPVVNQYIVEKIMGVREGTRELEPEDPEDAKTEPEDNCEDGKTENKENSTAAAKPEPKTITVTEYFVKYKNFSYLHCEWRTQEELEVNDKRVNQKIKRWQQKKSQAHSYMMNMVDEDELFNPEYVEVDRVLAESHIPPPEGTDEPESVYFLVKWRQLPYEDATWELAEDVDKTAIERYKKYEEPPKDTQRVPAPTPDQWKGGIKGDRMYKGGNQLREYQFEGVSWLTFCYYNRQNCILADEMGLGKTVQSITYLQAVYEYGIRGPFLVIAPLSTIGNWIREFDTWTDLNVIVYHGSSVSRQMLQDYDMFYKTESGQRRLDVFKFNALITTYEVIIQDVELLSQIEWRCCVIDEAHRLKNKNCKLMEGLRCFELEHKVLLSGTPLQNNVEELFSLLHFLEPARFKSSSEFLAEFGDLKTEGQVEKLKAILKPMMLRRLKEDVEKNLAPKEETIIEVELTNIQKKYYRAILERNFSFLSKGSTAANVPNLMNTMMELRKCCNHPYLIDGAEEQIIFDMKGNRRTSEDSDLLIEAMVQASGKLVLLDKLLPKLKAGKHKVLIFSQMIRVLDILEDYLINRKYIYERIDGRIRGNQRQEAIDRFSKPESDRFVFLLCTRAGGLGINLTAADTCVIYDSDWNPQNDLQAQARCHRIGQQKAVKVYRLICRNTYEREMFDKASLKLGLDKAVLQSMGANKEGANNTAAAPLSKQEVEHLLKKGAYGALMEDDQAGDRFCEEDIDQILQRRTQVITIEAVGKGSTFAKASFSSAGARDDIDINDPEFWQKWAKKADIETSDGKNELIIAEPRQRKQTKRYGGHGQERLEGMSELETSSDSESEERRAKGGRSRRGKKRDDDFEFDDNAPPPGCYARPECFKVEKLLLVYGWGRWADIVKHGQYRRPLDELDVQSISQAILLFSLQHFKGDVTIKRFIWELIMPSEDGKSKDIRNHILSTPTPRVRKSKGKNKKDNGEDGEDSMDGISQQGDTTSNATDPIDEKIQSCPIDTETVLSDAGYRKHLVKHSNKVLLRVRTLYYLKHEIISDDQCSKIFENINWSQIAIQAVPRCEGEPPATWWDKDSDKCLLIGVYKHGYEKYNLIRADSTLLFLSVCGPPDKAALRKEQLDDDDEVDKLDDTMNEDSPATPAAGDNQSETTTAQYLPFPSSCDLNTRFRRLISAYQKYNKKRQEAEAAAAERRSARLERSTVIRGKDIERLVEKKVKWTRREESDFYKVVSSFGVESNRRGKTDEPRQYVWDTFRQLASLHKKDDDMLSDYMDGFYYMCRRVCGKLTPAEEASPPSLMVDPISEERATRCMTRIELLNKIREEILWHDQLTKRLTLCQFSPEMPPWWKPGEHDKDLLIGAAKHGLAHMDQHILYDPKLCFKDLMLKSLTEPDRPKQLARAYQESATSQQLKTEEEESKEPGQTADTKMEPEDEKPKASAATPAKEKTSQKDESAEEDKSLVNGEMEHEAEEPATAAAHKEVREESVIKCEKPDNTTTVKSETVDSKTNGIQTNQEDSIPFYWPKDRVLYQRLELVCYCIEAGEWPTAAVSKKISQLASTSHLDTPVGTPNPSRTDTPNLSEYSCALDEDETESLKLTISRGSSRGRKPKRSRLDMEVDRIARLRDGADSECSQSTPLRGTPDSYLNGALAAGLTADDLLNSFIPPRKKRGRKSKAEKEAETRAATEAAVAASYHRIVSLDIDSDVRIPMINLEDGSRLMGEEAPLRKNLQSWMIEHPGYMAEIPDTLGSSSSSSQGALAGMSSSDRRSRKSAARSADNELPDLTNLTGAENVPVIHRDSQKRITGSKAPTLLQLSNWLDKNPHYDVDPVWGTLAKSILPEHLQNRIYSEKKKRKKETDVSISSSSAAASYAAQQQAAATQALLAASMQGYPMNMAAFNSLAAMGMPSSLLSLYGLGMGSDSSVDDETVKALAAAAAASTTSAHSAFPFQMYNPLFAYSSMLAGLGMTSSSYAQALASAGMLNGMMGFDTSSLTGAGSDMDADSAEKLAAMAASMGSNMNIMEELQLRSKMLEEMYGRAATATTSSSMTVTKEPGETSSASTSRTHHHRKSATVTKATVETHHVDEQPEDLSVRSKADGKDTSSRDPSSEGRVSRTSGSDVPVDQSDKLSDSVEGRLSSASNHVEGRLSRTSELSNNDTTNNKTVPQPEITHNESSETADEAQQTEEKMENNVDDDENVT